MKKTLLADKVKRRLRAPGLLGQGTLAQKLLAPIAIIAFALLGVFGYLTYRQGLDEAQAQARIVAAAVERQVKADRTYYAENVVPTAIEAGLEVTNHFRDPDKLAIPLPATYLREVAEDLNGSATTAEYRLNSLSLFPINPEKKPRNEVERRYMTVNFDQKIIQETLTRVDGQAVYTRYVPDVAHAESCVACHNSLAQSPKRDYQIGDVMGSLVITVPMQERLNQVVVGTVTQVGLFGGILILAGLIFYPLSQRTILGPISQLAGAALEVSTGNLDVTVESDSDDELGQLVRVFNSMTGQLRQTIAALEIQPQMLRAVVEIGQNLIGISDLNELMRQIVTLTKERFDYYHVQVYLLNEAGDALFLAESYGQIGERLKRQQNNIPLAAPKNMVARAARSGNVVLIEDVSTDKDWTPNPLLPETQAEMAVPIKLRAQVVGVLDVHGREKIDFGEEKATTLMAMANQIAVAIYNVQRFEETYQTLAEAEKLQRRYLQTSWQDYLPRRETTTYQQVQPGAAPVDERVLDQVRQRTTQGQTVVRASPATNGDGSEAGQSVLAAPLAIRGQVVGTLRVHDTGPGRSWSSEEIALIESISEQMSLAIENARLFDKTQRRAAREQLTREITDKMRAAPDMDTIIQTGLTELARALGVSRSYVKLSTELDSDD